MAERQRQTALVHRVVPHEISPQESLFGLERVRCHMRRIVEEVSIEITHRQV